jgi:hypothetical protein
MEEQTMTPLQKISSCCVIASFLMNFFQINVKTVQQSIALNRDRVTVEIVQQKDLVRQD